MDRRAFLKTLGAAAAISQVPLTTPVATAPIDNTLTGRILRTLTHRKGLGQVSAAIVVSPAGFRRIEQEHGLEASHQDISLRGVPVFQRPELSSQSDYWVLERRPRGL